MSQDDERYTQPSPKAAKGRADKRKQMESESDESLYDRRPSRTMDKERRSVSVTSPLMDKGREMSATGARSVTGRRSVSRGRSVPISSPTTNRTNRQEMRSQSVVSIGEVDMIESGPDSPEEEEEEEPKAEPKKRGRPKGSKNKTVAEALRL